VAGSYFHEEKDRCNEAVSWIWKVTLFRSSSLQPKLFDLIYRTSP
jgi:hypothetical protein